VTERERLPNRRPTENREIRHQSFTFVASIGCFEDGRLAEVFISSRKSGSDMAAAARDASIVVSIALQYGVSAETIRHALGRNSDGSAASPLGVVPDQLAAEGTL
jgi:post-segregation antitoxin (ccd killing protein)